MTGRASGARLAGGVIGTMPKGSILVSNSVNGACLISLSFKPSNNHKMLTSIPQSETLVHLRLCHSSNQTLLDRFVLLLDLSCHTFNSIQGRIKTGSSKGVKKTIFALISLFQNVKTWGAVLSNRHNLAAGTLFPNAEVLSIHNKAW